MKMISKIFCFVLVILISSNLCARTVVSINDSWGFAKRDIAIGAVSDETNWEKVNLPHTWNAQDGYVDKNYFRGTCSYKKMLTMPSVAVDKVIYLQFEGVLSFAQVYLNGKWVGEHKGGYTAFGFDISKAVLFGQKNELLVKVNNENKDIAPLHGDFTCWGGIYRDVKLITTEKVRFAVGKYADDGILIRTPQVSADNASVHILAQLSNQSLVSQKVILKSIIRKQTGEIVASQSLKVALNPLESIPIVLDKLKVKSPSLWSPESPNLYVVETLMMDQKSNQIIDQLTNNIGFRWFSMDGQKGFFLNGKHLKLVGVNRHQDFDGLGSALTDDFHRSDVQIMKDMGVNFLRIAHYPQDKALLDACDKQGILAWEEIPMVDIVSFNDDYYANCETNLKEMIYQHLNHPSVIAWGFMNEIYLWVNKTIPKEKRESYYKHTVAIAHKLDSVVHKIDPSRLTTMALHVDSAYETSGLAKITDVVGWNVYKGWYGDEMSDFCKFMDAQHADFPNRPLIVSEYGAGSDRRIHTQHGQSFDFSMEYQQQFHEAYLPYILARDYIAGSSMWNMNDFGSADRDESMPRINNKGLLYYNREPKDIYYYYQAMLSKSSVVHIATNDWFLRTAVSELDNQKVSLQPVKVYSNLNEAELLVDGHSYGIKKMVNCNAVWSVPFHNGKSTIVARSVDKAHPGQDATTVEFKIIPSDLQASSNQSLEIGVNCGSNCDFTDDKSKFTWLADRPYKERGFGYMGGEIYKSKPWVVGFIDQVFETRNVPLFQTIRYGATGYRFDVPNGEYEVELSFTEPNTANQKILPKENVFDVVVNGIVVFPAYNIAENGGRLFSITKKIATKAVSGLGINIELKAIKGTTLISAIKVVRVI